MKNKILGLLALCTLMLGACVKKDLEAPMVTAEGRAEGLRKGNFLMQEERISIMSDVAIVKHFYQDGRLVKAISPEGPVVLFAYDPSKRTVTATYTTSAEVPYAREIFYFNHRNQVVRSELTQLSGLASTTSYGYQEDLIHDITTVADQGNGVRLQSRQQCTIRNGMIASIETKEETYQNNTLIRQQTSKAVNRCTNPYRIELYDESGRLFNILVFSPRVKSPTYNLWIFPNVDLSRMHIPRPGIVRDNGQQIALLNWYTHGMLQVEDTYIYPDGRTNYWRTDNIRVNTDMQPLSFLKHFKGYDKPDTAILKFDYTYIRL